MGKVLQANKGIGSGFAIGRFLVRGEPRTLAGAVGFRLFSGGFVPVGDVVVAKAVKLYSHQASSTVPAGWRAAGAGRPARSSSTSRAGSSWRPTRSPTRTTSRRCRSSSSSTAPPPPACTTRTASTSASPASRPTRTAATASYVQANLDLDSGLLKITTTGTATAGGNFNGDNTLDQRPRDPVQRQHQRLHDHARASSGPLGYIDERQRAGAASSSARTRTTTSSSSPSRQPERHASSSSTSRSTGDDVHPRRSTQHASNIGSFANDQHARPAPRRRRRHREGQAFYSRQRRRVHEAHAGAHAHRHDEGRVLQRRPAAPA